MKKIIIVLSFLLSASGVYGAQTLYEYYTEQDQILPSVSERTQIANQAGIEQYNGSYEQNMALLSYLQDLNYNSNSNLGASFRPSGIDVNIRQDLVSGASRSDTTLDVDSLVTLDGRRLVMTDIGIIGFGKIDQGNSNEEIISWTGMTDNTTYYTLTGMQWGYDFYANTTSTSNYKKHNAGARFIITNDDHWLSKNYINLNDVQTIPGVKTFNQLPESSLTATTSNQFVNKTYADNIANQGAATSTETVAGISELATLTEQALSTIFSADEPHVMSSENATSTPWNDSIGAGYSCVTEDDGNISTDCLPVSESITWSGDNTHSGGDTFSGNATSTGLFVHTSSSVSTLPINGNDVVNKTHLDAEKGGLIYASSTQKVFTMTDAGTTYNVRQATLDVSGMEVNDILKVNSQLETDTASGNETLTIAVGDGSATTTFTYAKTTNYDNLMLEITLYTRNSLSAQVIVGEAIPDSTTYAARSTYGVNTLDLTGNLYINMTALSSSQAGRVARSQFIVAEIIKYRD